MLTLLDDWHATFHRIPKAVNDLVEERGGNRLCDIGLADAANSGMFTDFDGWGESTFWPAVTAKFGGTQSNEGPKPKSGFQVEVSSGMRASTLGLQLQQGYVVENKLLSHPGVPVKRMIRFKLPSDMTYQCGDYLAVLPVNPSSVVRRAISRFDMPWDAMLTIKKQMSSGGATPIPLDTPISAFDLLSTYVELSQPASKRDLNILADAAATDQETQAELRYFASSPSRFSEEIVKRRLSPLDLLMRYPNINLPIGDFLALLPPMRVRQYSISSSPLADPTECSITFSVLNAPSLASQMPANEEAEEQYLGVASNYLSELRPGERAQIIVRPSHTGFKPPADLKTPMIMACAGSGLAPFRGFIMDRAEKIRGRGATDLPDVEKPAKAILYVGCRTEGKDDIHADELAEWEKLGAVSVRWAHSRPSDGSGRHVQDLMMEDRKELVELFEAGARVYICGTTGVGNAVKEVCKTAYIERRREKIQLGKETGEDVNEEEKDDDTVAEEFWDRMKTKERFATDVFT